MAAGRYTSHGTSIGRLPRLRRCSASLPEVVVLPEPCRPVIITTAGEPTSASPTSLPPRSCCNSSRTTLVTCCAGENAVRTSAPTAFSRTRLVKSLTTLKWTSASRSATRISLSALSICHSLRLPSPRSVLKTRSILSCKLSNMRGLETRGGPRHSERAVADEHGQERAASALVQVDGVGEVVEIIERGAVIQNGLARSLLHDLCEAGGIRRQYVRCVRRDDHSDRDAARAQQAHHAGERLHVVRDRRQRPPEPRTAKRDGHALAENPILVAPPHVMDRRNE